ncbi:MAG: HD-GYP domain-containing protein [Planctomycetes bacterium]|nr:HD-GYP domain-containing protein [Planctomycetota bacterium]
MKVLEVDKLPAGQRLVFPYYHESGRLLLASGRVLENEHLRSLREAGIRQVFECDTEDEVVRLRNVAGRKMIPIESLVSGALLEQPLFDEDGIVLLTKGQTIKPSYLAILKRRGLAHVYVDPVQKVYEVERFNLELLRGVARQLEERIQAEKDLRVSPDGRAFGDITRRQKIHYSIDEKDALLSNRRGVVEKTDDILKKIARGSAVASEITDSCIETLAQHILDTPNLLLATTFLREKDDYLAEHAVGVCSIALAMGATLSYSERQVKELALAAFLADLGMVKVPDEILKKPGTLTAEEWREIRKHPIHGLNMIQQFSAIPETVGLAVYQSHEREDGSGYPRQRRAMHIHDYARILAVADMYVAMGSARYWRPAMAPYQAIETLVRMAAKGTIHPDMIRALLKSISLYPIGSWVQLNTGERGRVIASNGDAIDRPIVTVLLDSQGRALREAKVVDLKGKPHLKVVKYVEGSPDGQSATAGF